MMAFTKDEDHAKTEITVTVTLTEEHVIGGTVIAMRAFDNPTREDVERIMASQAKRYGENGGSSIFTSSKNERNDARRMVAQLFPELKGIREIASLEPTHA